MSRLARLSYQTNKHRGRRHSLIVSWQRGAGVLRAFSFRHAGHPKIRSPAMGNGASQILMKMKEPAPSPGRQSGHHLYENGDSDYAEDEDHE
jgi:hypothetical protein